MTKESKICEMFDNEITLKLIKLIHGSYENKKDII